MCGIAGRLSLDGRPADRALLHAMADVMRHRGPDDEGVYVDGGFGMIMRRLSIIDVAAGHQPLANEDRSVWTIFNGEIYNHPELREQLMARGHQLRTSTDTEVIVHLYEELGPRCVDALRGMFAFAVWDERAQSLLLARDRLGKKPLYYAVVPGRALVFASELKAILEDETVDRTIDLEALDQYASLLYIPAPRSPFVAVRKLPAGCVLHATASGISVRRYWDVPAAPTARPVEPERFGQLLDEATRIRLRSDVPLGAFLSGGVDSSAVVATMQRFLPAPVMTTSIGFDSAGDSELPYADLVARHVGANHAAATIGAPSPALLERLAWHLDEPFADSSAVPTFFVSRAARERVTVALSGDGGDELFAGYSRHWLEHIEHRIRALAGRATAAVAAAGGMLPAGVKGRNTLMNVGVPPDEACARKFYYDPSAPAVKRALYSPAFRELHASFDTLEPFKRAFREAPTADPLSRILYVDLKTYLCDDILFKVDRMSMATSLEVRAPLLDQDLVEFAITLPVSAKLAGRGTKRLLRDHLAALVPREAFERPKHGFVAPIGRWLRHDLDDFVQDTVCSDRARGRGYFDHRAVRDLVDAHRRGSPRCPDPPHAIWMLLMLELWHRVFVDRPRRSRAVADVVTAASADR
jgi:asparagine synthase (glutamine-hydrolysing)